MASSGARPLTFLRGSGFLLSLVGTWDLMADEFGPWPAQKGFVIFKETKITAVIERQAAMRRGLEGTYAVEGNRLRITALTIDTAPTQGALHDGEFTLAGDLLTIRWLTTPPQVDTFRRRVLQGSNGAVLPPVAIYATDRPDTSSQG